MSNEKIFEDTFNMLCGRLIGEGIHRKVFKCKIRPDLVVKVEEADGYERHFANWAESKFWTDNQHYEAVSKWLAPTEYLSPDARVLLQVRCEPVPESFKLPEQVPSFLTDLKRDNFGFYQGRLVCFDYALALNTPNVRLKKVEW